MDISALRAVNRQEMSMEERVNASWVQGFLLLTVSSTEWIKRRLKALVRKLVGLSSGSAHPLVLRPAAAKTSRSFASFSTSLP